MKKLLITLSVISSVILPIGIAYAITPPPNSAQLAPTPSNGNCLTTNGSINAWSSCSSGGGSGGGTFSTSTSNVPGRNTNHPTSNSDIVTIGSSSTTTAPFYFDPNIFVGFLKNATTTYLGIAGPLFDTSSSIGTAGFTLMDTASGVKWVATTTFSSPLLYSAGNVTCQTATGSVPGCLSAADWTTFNGKQAAGTYVTAVSVASANGLAGSSSGGATPALTLSTSITGVLKGNGTAISAAANGTDYTLLTATSCATGNAVNAVTASGGVTCGAAFSTTSADAYINASSTIAHPAGGATGNLMEWNGSAWTSVSTTSSAIGLQPRIGLTTSGTSGAATFDGTTLNIPQYAGGAGGGAGTMSTTSPFGTTQIQYPTFSPTVTSLDTSATSTSKFYFDPAINLVRASGSVGTTSLPVNFINANNLTLNTPLTGTSGGTGQSAVNLGDILFGTSPGTWGRLTGALDISEVLTSAGISNTALWGKVSLTSMVSNVLPIANGGTNASSFTTSGNSVYYNGTSLLTAPLTSAVTTPYASSTGMSSLYASSTVGNIGTLTLPNIVTPAGTFLAADATGKVIATTTPSGGSGSPYPFNLAGATNATNTPLMILASTTVGNGNQNGGLTVFGGATTTGAILVQGTATSTIMGTTTIMNALIVSTTTIPNLSQAPSFAISSNNSMQMGTTSTAGLLNLTGSSAGSSTKGVCFQIKAVGSLAYIYSWYDSSATQHVTTASCTGTGTTTIIIE